MELFEGSLLPPVGKDCEAMAPGAIREREAESKAPSLTQLRGRVPRGSICLCIYFILNMSLNFSGVHLPSPENQIKRKTNHLDVCESLLKTYRINEENQGEGWSSFLTI